MPVERDDADMSAREATELAIFKETEKARAARIADAWAITMGTPQGRAVVWDIIIRSGRDDDPIRPGDTHLTYAAMGRQAFGRELYETARARYPRYFLDMVKENVA